MAVLALQAPEPVCAGFPRERIQVLAPAQVAVLEDFATLTIHGKKKLSFGKRSRRRMGHREALGQFVAALRGEPNELLTWSDVVNASLCMFGAQESIRTGQPVDLRQFRQTLMTDKT